MSGARLYKVGAPYNATELPEIDFEQSADVMYLAHWDHAPTKLLRFAHTNWQFVTVTFGPTIVPPASLTATPTLVNNGAATVGGPANDFPTGCTYVVTAVDDDTEQESHASVSATATNDLSLKGNFNTIAWPAVTGATRYTVYKADSVVGSTTGYIGTTTGLLFTDNNIGPDYTDTPPLGKTPFDVAGNWPSTVTFFEQRLIWARTKNKPNGVFGSQSGNYENMDISRPLKPDDALSFALVAGRVNAVNQLVALTDLLALTSDGLFKINGGGQGGYLTPTNIVSRRQVGYGSARLGPLVIGNAVLFKPSVGSSVRTIGYTFQIDGYESNNVSIYSPHFFIGFDIVSWCYAQEPLSCIWAARSDGALLCFTWEQEQQVWGWTLCQTNGFVESVCAITELGEDRVYLVVRRTIGGVDKRYVERMASAIFTTLEECCFLDAAISYSFDTPTSVITGLWHLEGCPVGCLADGSVESGLIVTGGQVTLPYAASTATVGLSYTATVETLPLAIAIQGTSVGKRQNISQVTFKLLNSGGLSAGSDGVTFYDFKPRQEEPYNAPNALLTGFAQVNLPPRWSDGATVIVQQNQPLPFTITAILIDPVVTQ